MRWKLEEWEFRYAVQVGTDRRISAILKKYKPRYGYEDFKPWQDDIEGACAECAVSAYLGKIWCPETDVPDDGNDVDGMGVRSTQYSNGCLLLHPPDADDRIFILVTGCAPELTLRGWILGGEGKARFPKKDKHGKGRPCHWVEQEALKPMHLLKDDLQ